MFKRFNFNLIARISIISLVLFSSAYAEIRVKDDSGNVITLKQPAERIISLAPHATESLFAAGAGDKIIGAVSYSDYPEAAKLIPRVGGYPSLDIEKIVTLKPDLIVAWASGNNQKQVTKLAALGFNVFMSEPKQPRDIAKTIKRFGKLAGTSAIANKAATDFILQENFSKTKKVKVFYQFWNKPIMTVNRNHLISNVINLCGGINVFSDLHSLTPKVSIEAVLATNTDVIIAGGKGDKKEKWISEWEVWTQLAAVKNKQIYFIDPDLLNRAGPRILDGAEQLCNILEKARNL
jgi:iron complex transport system substrate-binding protein